MKTARAAGPGSPAATSAPRPGRPRCSAPRATSTRTSCPRTSATTRGSWGSRPRTIRGLPGRSSCRTEGTAGPRRRPSRAPSWSASFRSLIRVRECSSLPAWRSLSNFDWILFLAILAACSIGLVVIYSATTGTPSAGAFHRQLIWLLLGIVLMLLAVLIDYHTLAEFASAFYGLSLALLLLTLVYGRVVNSSKSWLGIGGVQFQPSEIAKVSTILMLAAYLGRERVRGLGALHFAAICAIIGLPVL